MFNRDDQINNVFSKIRNDYYSFANQFTKYCQSSFTTHLGTVLIAFLTHIKYSNC